MKNLKDKVGFTLIELLVVISIIGVLTAILMMNFVGARERSRDSQKIQDLISLKNALRMYYNDNQTYPSVSISDCTTCLNDVLSESYLTGVSEMSYSYSAAADGNSFTAEAVLENGAGDDDIESQRRCGVATPVDKVYMVCAN